MGKRVVGGVVVVAVIFCGIAAAAAAPRGEDGAVLPLRRVRLYETGVGYFERSGRITSRTRLPIPSAHLDDALKSLVVLGGGPDARMQGVHFDTLITEQLGRALARLPTEEGAALDFEALTRSLTGMQVELAARGRVQRGRLLQVLSADTSGLERCLPGQDAPAREPDEHAATRKPTGKDASLPCVLRQEPGLLLLSEHDELMRFALADVERVRPVRAADADRLWSAFSGAAQAARAEHDLALRALQAPPRSAGAVPQSEDVTLGYVAEAPLWRTTHRLVLGADGKATLQVWSLLHNDGDEDWKRVQVELVSGQPDSFLFPVAAPRYARRRLVTLEQNLPSVPQLLDRTADEMWDRGEGEESIGLGGLGMIGRGYGGGGTGHGYASASGVQESSLLAIGDLAQHEQAEGVEAGALFRYSLPEPIDLPARRSLLVPILTAEVPITRISYFADFASTAQSALVFRNATQQTLPAGTVAIFEAGGFGGESALDRLKPGQQRLLPFGLDLDLELEAKSESSRDTRRMLRYLRGNLIIHFEQVAHRTLVLQNRSGQARRVHVALALVNNARVEQADAVLSLDDGSVSAVYDVPAQSKREVTLRTVQGLEENLSGKQLTAGKLAAFAADAHLPAAQRALLRQAASELAERERLLARRKRLEHELSLLTRSATRTRQSLPIVAKADPERGRTLAARLVETEAKITATERARTALDPDAPWHKAQGTLRQLNGAPGPTAG
jgi:hypothetical protein